MRTAGARPGVPGKNDVVQEGFGSAPEGSHSSVVGDSVPTERMGLSWRRWPADCSSPWCSWRLPPASIDVAILAHVYHEIARPYEFMYPLRAALAPGARIGIVEVDKPTQDHGTPVALLQCELGAVGYRRAALTSLQPADGYLAIFLPPEALPRPGSIRPWRQ